MNDFEQNQIALKAQSSAWRLRLENLRGLLLSLREYGLRHEWFAPTALTIFLLGTICFSVCIGTYPMPIWKAGNILARLSFPWPLPDDLPWPVKELTVVQVIRFPRVLLAALVGLGLGISGTALQGLMRNPLVGPDLVGVSSGAAMGGVLAVMLNWSPVSVMALAFVGGLLSMGATFTLARIAKSSDGIGLILSGIFVGGFCISAVGMGIFLADDGQLNTIIFWLLGNLNHADRGTVWLVAVPTLLGGSILMLLRWRLNLLSLGNDDAFAIGINVRILRLGIIAVVSLIVAAQVSAAGIIGWVGLVIPHWARMLVGPDHRKLLPVSALLGGLFVLLIDDFTRVVLRANVPIGVLTTLIGTPFICFMFWKKQTKGWIGD
ncbi:MAG: iron ABC transporter permease [Deltaproteobacteria bacterium]|jgi:iron complex transport system permease protein|nr:iron ABC transporter permease [Deltaproteobacteria bacterium]